MIKLIYLSRCLLFAGGKFRLVKCFNSYLRIRLVKYVFYPPDYYGDGGLESGGGGNSHSRPDVLGSDTSFHGHGRPPYSPIGSVECVL